MMPTPGNFDPSTWRGRRGSRFCDGLSRSHRYFRALGPDVLLSDMGLAGKDGNAFIREVRARPREKGGRIPAAALTAFTRSQDATRAREAGFDMHVPKPVEPFEIVDVVADLVGLRHSRP